MYIYILAYHPHHPLRFLQHLRQGLLLQAAHCRGRHARIHIGHTLQEMRQGAATELGQLFLASIWIATSWGYHLQMYVCVYMFIYSEG